MDYYSLSCEETQSTIQTDAKCGLTQLQADKRLEKYGENKLRAKKKKTSLVKFFEQFKDTMILILLAAAGVSFAIAVIEKNPSDFFEPLLILLIVVLNAVMGVMQENKAEKALEALQKMSAPHARVLRDGRESVIDAALLVPGDVIIVEAGDFIPADARLFESASLKCEESALTGESVPSEKDYAAKIESGAPLGDRVNMIYSGCSVAYGRGKAIVTATGMETEMGKIANLLDSEEDTQTPLQHKLAVMGKYLGIAALAACAVVFVVGLIGGIDILEIFMTAVSLAVSAIPEGLPAIVTIVLSIGVGKMAKNNAIVKKLPAVETLGSASVICSDKTGTLTQNRMTLVKAYCCENEVFEDISENNSESVRKLLKFASLCCDGAVECDGENVKHIGDPTETSIVYAAHINGIEKEELNQKYARVAEIPFDSDRKLMTVVNEIDGKLVVTVKGAFDVLATRCISGDIAKAKEITQNMSEQALRVIAVAQKTVDKVPKGALCEDLECGLTLLGLVGMIDPPREEAKSAVAVCREAGIRPVMITGDHIVTACAIAKQIGIMNEGDKSMLGSELEKMSDEELAANVENVSVYARVSPQDKIRIVKAWQSKGAIVSMTGDGVNDAPALKAADIGCAMGITGTDVAKGAADMTLTDDNFATIVKAVEEGRGIYDNIRKAVGFLLGTNITELLSVFLSMLFFKVSPLLSMQLLWINLVTDSFPAIALGMEPVDSLVMKRKPKPKDESIFAHGFGVEILLQAVLFTVLTVCAFVIGKGISIEAGRTMAFITLALLETVHSFSMRSQRSLFDIGFFTNKKLNIATLVSLLLIVPVVFTPIRTAFGMIKLDVVHYLIAFGLALVPLVYMELFKLAKRIAISRKNLNA